MAFDIVPLGPGFVAEIRGLDLRGTMPATTIDGLTEALYRHAVLVFRGQTLTPEQHIAFSRNFGELDSDTTLKKRVDGHPELLGFGNATPDLDGFTPTENGLDQEEWHTDHSHHPIPAKASLLYARAVPEIGGETWYADTRAAYDALPETLFRRIEGLTAVHTADALLDFRHAIDKTVRVFTEEERQALPQVAHPLIKTHPQTGRKALYFGSQVVRRIPGLSAEAGKALLRELTIHTTQDRFVYRHKWRVGDLIAWDNRSVLHTGTHYDKRKYTRVMHRTTVRDTVAVA